MDRIESELSLTEEELRQMESRAVGPDDFGGSDFDDEPDLDLLRMDSDMG